MLLTNHPYFGTSVICPKFQVFNFHFSEGDERSMSNKQKLCKVKIFELQTMSIDERFAVKNSVISCLALILNLSNDQQPKNENHECKKLVQGSKNRFIYDD